MTREKIQEKISQILLENLPNAHPEDLSDNIELYSLGLDSLNAVSIVLGLEEIFGFEFEMDEISHERFITMGNITQLIEEKIVKS
ncbi:MAG: hypothetical protein DSM107014_16000 [Gomphosphaeria aponina SAG 52.96 = DSM 107014]|uniref:Carrier domain-containing protein n=1 Tax=Gomphosphaeria aponina SAG 52.96 = DSM 107014 TaxID=1521640 RepID=A0A941JVM1_9CHRO|nr:hypothetical protein [Gomphosphaeria aponina SAG 52.96 = DSM 107014]